jgi:hypothetical protein
MTLMSPVVTLVMVMMVVVGMGMMVMLMISRPVPRLTVSSTFRGETHHRGH